MTTWPLANFYFNRLSGIMALMKKLVAFLTTLLIGIVHAALPEEEVPIVILGGGIGAMTSATYLGRAGIPPLVISGPSPGGAILQSMSVQNWPGELEITGLELAARMQKQAEASGAKFLPEVVTHVDFSQRPFVITTQKGFGLQKNGKTRKIRAKACILALGATPNFLGAPGESDYWLRGVYNCAVCDGGLYKDKIVAVVGGGDSALTEAQYLSNLAKKVYIVVRKDSFKTIEEKRKEEILNKSNIEVLYTTAIEEVRGNGNKVTELFLNNKTSLPVDALFLAIGSTPNSDIVKGQVELDDHNYIVLKNIQETSVSGVYAVGDLADPEFKQAVTAAGDGAKAALQAQKYLASYKKGQSGHLPALAEAPHVTYVDSKTQLDQEIKSAGGPTFVYFTSPHCGPCRSFTAAYEQWSKDYGDKVKFLKVDSSHSLELFNLYQVQSVPTIFVFDEKGNIIRKATGLNLIAEVGLRLEENKESIDSQTFR